MTGPAEFAHFASFGSCGCGGLRTRRLSRRQFLCTSAAGAVAAPAIAASVTGPALAQQPPGAAAPGRAILIKDGCVLSLRPGGRRLRAGRRAGRRRQDLRRAAEHQRRQCRGDRRREHDRHAGLRRYPPPHVAGHPAQRPARRLARATTSTWCSARSAPIYTPDDVYAGDLSQRARRDRHRRHLRARLVAHPQHARAHRRGHQGACRVRRARGVRLRQSAERVRPMVGRAAPQVSGRHRAPAQAVLLQRRPADDALSGGALGRARRDPARRSRPRARWARASASMSASASGQGGSAGEAQRRQGAQVRHHLHPLLHRSTTPNGS